MLCVQAVQPLLGNDIYETNSAINHQASLVCVLWEAHGQNAGEIQIRGNREGTAKSWHFTGLSRERGGKEHPQPRGRRRCAQSGVFISGQARSWSSCKEESARTWIWKRRAGLHSIHATLENSSVLYLRYRGFLLMFVGWVLTYLFFANSCCGSSRWRMKKNVSEENEKKIVSKDFILPYPVWLSG